MLHKSTYVTLNRNIPACLAFSLQLNCFWTTWSIVSFLIVGAGSPGTPANDDNAAMNQQSPNFFPIRTSSESIPS